MLLTDIPTYMSVYTVLHSTAHLVIVVNKAILLSNKYIYYIFIAVVPWSIRTHATDRPDRRSDLRQWRPPQITHPRPRQ